MINVDCSVYHRILISFEVSKIINVKMQRPLLKCNFLSQSYLKNHYQVFYYYCMLTYQVKHFFLPIGRHRKLKKVNSNAKRSFLNQFSFIFMLIIEVLLYCYYIIKIVFKFQFLKQADRYIWKLDNNFVFKGEELVRHCLSCREFEIFRPYCEKEKDKKVHGWLNLHNWISVDMHVT